MNHLRFQKSAFPVGWLLYISAIFLFMILTKVNCSAQKNSTDSINRLRKNKAIQLTKYDSLSIYTNLNGIKYEPTYISATETPFFNNSQTLKGTLNFNHLKLENIPLIYDIKSDKLIFNSNPELIELQKEMVEKFTLFETKDAKHDFVNISFNIKNSGNRDGYFEVIYDSKKFKIYVKHNKELDSKMKYGLIDYSYSYSETYYLYYSGQYFHIKNLNSLVVILEKSGDRLKNFIKNQKFSRYRLIEKQITACITYFDSVS